MQLVCGCVVVEVVAVCVAPCIRFGRSNVFLLPFQIEEFEGTSATTVTRGWNHAWSLLVEVPSFMDGNSHYL